MKAEITFDLTMAEDMPFAEGCYRIEGGAWQVFIFRHVTDVKEKKGVEQNLTWDSGVTGLNAILPEEAKINKSTVLQVMSDTLGVTEWSEVRGPDSMALR